MVKAVLFPIPVNGLGPFDQDDLDIVIPATQPQRLGPIAQLIAPRLIVVTDPIVPLAVLE